MQLVLPRDRPLPPEVRLSVAPLGLLPDDLKAWIQRALGGDLGAGLRLEIVGERETATLSGWPMRLVEAQVMQGDEPKQARLGAFYAFLEHSGFVMVTAPSRASIADCGAALLDILGRAEPDFSGEVAALASLWDLPPPPKAAPHRTEPPPRTAAALTGGSDEAIAAWEHACELDPGDVDSRYNLGLAHYQAGRYEPALERFHQAADLDPADFLLLRKVVQAQIALGRLDDAAATRDKLRSLWRASADPRARLLSEYVMDQIRDGERRVFAYETVAPRNPVIHPVFRFVAVDEQGHELPLQVAIETSEAAKERGVPYVLVLEQGGARRVVGTATELPPYPRLRETALALLRGEAP